MIACEWENGRVLVKGDGMLNLFGAPRAFDPLPSLCVLIKFTKNVTSPSWLLLCVSTHAGEHV